MHLRTPLVASASPLSQELDGIRHLDHAGASAKKPPSLNTISRRAARVLQSLSLTFLSPANSAPALKLILTTSEKLRKQSIFRSLRASMVRLLAGWRDIHTELP